MFIVFKSLFKILLIPSLISWSSWSVDSKKRLVGIVKLKVTPGFRELFSTQIFPEWASIISLHIASPKPTPQAFDAVLLLSTNGSNID